MLRGDTQKGAWGPLGNQRQVSEDEARVPDGRT